MELLIKIPEEEYKRMKEKSMFGRVDIWKDAIRNGTVLPEGHGALKDADKLAVAIAMIRDRWNYYGNGYESACFRAYDNCVDKIIDAPTIIEAEQCDDDCEHCEWATCPKMEVDE